MVFGLLLSIKNTVKVSNYIKTNLVYIKTLYKNSYHHNQIRGVS